MTKRKDQTKRKDIIDMIDNEGPADIATIASRLKRNKSSIQQIMARMKRDGQLSTFKNAPRTYITTTFGRFKRDGKLSPYKNAPRTYITTTDGE